MPSPRVLKLADQIKGIVATMLERRVKDPRLGFVTVTDVRLTGDSREASVFYTVLGNDADYAATARGAAVRHRPDPLADRQAARAAVRPDARLLPRRRARERPPARRGPGRRPRRGRAGRAGLGGSDLRGRRRPVKHDDEDELTTAARRGRAGRGPGGRRRRAHGPAGRRRGRRSCPLRRPTPPRASSSSTRRRASPRTASSPAWRRLLGTRKVGHAGTLDPMATGVLVVGVGRATRLLGHLTLTDKAYDATVRLGVGTVTDDAEGDSRRRRVRAGRTGAAWGGARRARGPILQVPTAVLVIEVDGVRSYARVRAGEEVALVPRPVTVHRLESVARRDDERRRRAVVDLDVVVECTSGT